MIRLLVLLAKAFLLCLVAKVVVTYGGKSKLVAAGQFGVRIPRRRCVVSITTSGLVLLQVLSSGRKKLVATKILVCALDSELLDESH